MTGEELNILSKIKVRPVEEQRDYLLEQNMLLTGKIATLEKENAELKEKLNFSTQYYQGEKAKDQLTKAKEIIRTFLNMPMPNNEEVFADVGIFLTKAEQFLKEIEENEILGKNI